MVSLSSQWIDSMPYRITEACTKCGLCVDVCPLSAIEPAEPVYVINDTCCDFEECLAECPESAIVRISEGEALMGDGASHPTTL